MLHLNAGLGRIAGILSLEVENGNSKIEAIQRVGSELAMHIVAAKPLFLTKELVSTDALENEHEILKSQVSPATVVLCNLLASLGHSMNLEILYYTQVEASTSL